MPHATCDVCCSQLNASAAPDVLALVWELVVHADPGVRCLAARLCDALVPYCPGDMLRDRLLPALITLSNDPDQCVASTG
jgi:hypothetical protein